MFTTGSAMVEELMDPVRWNGLQALHGFLDVTGVNASFVKIEK